MKLVTLDFETFYDQDFSLSKMTTEAYIRDSRFEVIGYSISVDGAEPTWHTGNEAFIAKSLGSQKWWDDVGLVAHNAAFDGAILAWRFGIVPKFYFDTLSMARPKHGLTCGGSLKALAEHYQIGVKGTECVDAKGKRRGDFHTQDLAAYGKYCKNDVALTTELFHILRRGFPTSELKVIDLMLRMYTQPVLELDKQVLIEHFRDCVQKRKDVLASVAEHAGNEEIQKVLNSNQKFADLLRSFGCEPPMKTSLTTGKETYAFSKTDVAFKELLEHEDERVRAVVAARLGTKSTIEESRTEAFMRISRRGALPILLNYYGGHTGRASGGDGVNLQNLPRGGALRRSIRAPEGLSLVVGDSAQIEARMNAWYAGQDDLVAAFAAGEDIYSLFASDVYGRKITKADKTERHVGKTSILGLGYGMGADKFKHTLKVGKPSVDMELAECRDVVNLYRAKYDRIKANWAVCEGMLHDIANGRKRVYGCVYTSSEGIHLPNGMLVRYPGLHQTDEGFVYMNRKKEVKIYGGKVVENLIQALARIVVFDQMLVLAGMGYKVAMTVHDEVVMGVPDEQVEAAKATMEHVMSQTPEWAAGLPIACEVDSGKCYGDAK